MKINLYTQKPLVNTNFKGVREDRNTVSQLKENNDYSLNELNQRRINKAIENLAKQKGEENIQFLLNVGENLKYQTNIDNSKKTKNDWRNKLKNAAEDSLNHSDPILKEKYKSEIKQVFNPKPLTNDEKNIVLLKNRVLNRIEDKKEREKISKNLDYFVISTETPIGQKKYILKRLDYFMSPKYEINSQLKDKKTEVLSEMVNDITINTPESKVPNIKAINQKTHGMCAAISIARKAVAYEDKPNYVDSILEELSSKDTMQIYDIQNLGSGKKVSVKKADVDFEYAQSRGYRIVDASTLQWMNIAGMYGAQNENMFEFNPFDKRNFDAFHDSFFMQTITDKKTRDKQSYFQALTKAKDEIISARSSDIKQDITELKNRTEYHKNIKNLEEQNKNTRNLIKSILPTESTATINLVTSDILQLQKPISDDIKKNRESLRKYSYIPNEETSQKIKKVKTYFEDNYSDKVNKASLENNAELIVESVADINNLQEKITPKSTLPKKIANARKLYEAEGIYRAANLLGFLEDDVQTDYLIKYNIPDRETRILKGFDKVIDGIENKNDKKLIKHFSERFGTDNKEEILERLTKVRDSVKILTTKGLDNCYYKIGVGDRRTVILSEISSIKQDIENGDRTELNKSATILHIKPDKNKILKEYTTLENKLLENPEDENIFSEAYNKLGAKNQINTYIDVFDQFVKSLECDNPDRQDSINTFCYVNNLTQESTEEEINAAISAVGNQFNSISQAVTSAENLLDVRNDDGTPYFTIYAPQILMKKLENNGALIPAKTMEKLQTRFAKIDKLRSSDEFSSRQGKISDPSLYKLSKEESDAIKQIDKKLNNMYKDVTRNLNYQYREIKEPLHKLANYVGTNAGNYWIYREGGSGLYSPQQVKIFEQITGKPYRAVEDIEEAIKIVKTSPHSGTSSTSVFHDRRGGHAQYVADIKSVGKSGKEALFHDNSWGPSEHENQWTDSEGLIRTDYSDYRGGELGYITDNDYLNGNYVDNLLHKKGHIADNEVDNKIYKKMHPEERTGYDFALMSDIILQGKNPKHKEIAGSLKDAIFIPDVYLVKDIGEKIQGMTKAEIEKSILRNKDAGKSYKKEYDEIIKKIETNNFQKGISTREEYNALPDNDSVKIIFEKAALRESYQDYSVVKKLSKAKTMKDVRDIQNEQRKEAYKFFEYAFSKTDEGLYYTGLEHNQEIVKSLRDSLKRNKISVTGKELSSIVSQIAIIKKDDYTGEFTGSLKDTINISIEKAGHQFDNTIKESEASKSAKEEWLNDYRKILEENTYFNKDDLKQEGAKAEGIRHWIDRKFEPKSDEEFVEIYKKLQDMPKDEFKKLTADIKDSELGIKEQTGYDVLYKVKASSEEYDNLLKNTIFTDKLYEDITPSKTSPKYKYNKMEKKVQSYLYKSRPFDDLYRSIYFSLQLLEYPKMFKKYEDISYRKYGAIPAYPHIDLSNDSVMNNKIEGMFDTIEKSEESINAQKNAIFDILLVNKLDEYRKTIPEGRRLTPMERDNLYYMTDKFITSNVMDSDFEKAVEAGYNIFELDKNATIADWNKELDVIVNTVRALENYRSKDDLKTSVREHSKALNHYINFFTDINIAPKYRRKIKEEINDIINLRSELHENGLDFDSENIDLQRKIQDNSINPYNKNQADKFGHLRTMINKAKSYNDKDNINVENLSEQINKINDYAEKYIENFIQPEKQEYIRANMTSWINKELVGKKENNREIIREKLNIAENKFQEDFHKYHILNNATTILDEYLLLSAKDAPEDKDGKKDIYKNYLENALNLAKFIEVQDILMEAVETGNPAQVKDYFKDYDIQISEDSVHNMNDDAAIDYMVRSLLLDDNTKTAKMLVEKLGLGDRIMQIEQNVMEVNNPKQYVDDTVKLLTETKEFTDVLNEELSNIKSNIDTAENVDKFITQAKRNLVEKTKEYTEKNKRMKKDVQEFVKAITNAKKEILENPDMPRHIFMEQNIDTAYIDRRTAINKELMAMQEYIQASLLVYRFLTSLHLPEGSKGEKIQKQMEKDYQELQQYSTQSIVNASEGMNVEFVRG